MHSRNTVTANFSIGLSFIVLGITSPTFPQANDLPYFDDFAPPTPMTVDGQSATLLPDGRWLFVGGRQDLTVNGAIVTREFPLEQAQVQKPSLPKNLAYPRYGHTATVLPDGSVLIFGGKDAGGSLVYATEILNLESGEITIANDTALTPRAFHSATLLTDGRVLIVGGQGTDGETLQQAELFDPDILLVEGREVRTVTPRRGQQAALLSTGDGLIWNGLDAAGNPVSTAELYDVSVGNFSAVDPWNSDRLPPGFLNDAPLTVEATLPEDNATNVSLDARAALRFSKRLSVVSATEQTIVLVGPAGAVSGKVIAAEAGRLAFFTPTAELLPDATYTLFLKGLVDTQGQGLPITTLSFRTQSIHPEAPLPTVSGAGHPSSSRVVSRSPASVHPLSRTAAATSDQGKQRKDLGDARENDKAKDADEYEDWLPRAAHRRGAWRVLGGPNEPRTNGALVVPPSLSAAVGETALSGRVARLNGRPIAGVVISIGNRTTRTDQQGRFLLSKIAAGPQELTVNGSAVTSNGRRYTTHFIQVGVTSSKTTVLPEPIYLARLNPSNEVAISSPAAGEIVVTNPHIPGLELRIPRGAVIRTRDGKVVKRLSITPLPVDRVPFAVPAGFPVYFTVQPAGAFVDSASTGSTQGIRVIYPNYLNAAPGTRVLFWNYDPSGLGWQVYGRGTASEDGKQVVPDEGVSQRNLMAFGWGLENTGNAPPEGPPPGGCTTAGDPVDCATGLFLHAVTDFYLEDTIPIALWRTYRQKDTISRDFGIGTNHSYGLFLSNPTGDTATPNMIDVVLPDGGRLRFNQIAGSTVEDILFQHNASPTRFHGARLQISTITHAWEMTLKDKSVYIFQPHSPNLLIGIRDRYGSTLTITRSGSNITQILSPHGRYLNFTYNAANRITLVADNAGRSVGYEYDGSGRLWKVTDANGKVEQYAYDSANRMTTVTDRRGNVMVTNVYDTNGRVQQQTLADGAIWQFAYTLGGGGKVTQTDVTDPRGFVRRAVFNSSGYLIQETLAVGQPEQRMFVYTRAPVTNLLTKTTDFLGRATRFVYDSRGNKTSVTRLYGTANAVTELFSYSATYSQLTSYTDPLGHVTQINYDTKGNPVSVSDPIGHTASANYDAEGKIGSVTNALGNTTSLAYDLGDLASVTDPLGRTQSTFTDRVGRIVGLTDPLGNNTRYAYDPLDRVTQVTDALSGVTSLTYDENGNILTFRDPRNLASHVYTYDSRNRVKTYTDPLGRVVTYNYDGLGNLTSRIDRKGQTASYLYGPLNRLKKITYPGGSTLTITRDDVNRTVMFADSANGTITQIYDNLRRLAREVSPQGQVDYQYDAASRRTQFAVAGQAAPIIYQYDDDDRLTQIAQGAVLVTFGYDAADRRTTVMLPNGVVGTYGFDSADQLLSIAFDKGGTHVGDLAYTYNASGRRIGQSGSLAKLLMPSASSSATYDAANRLTNDGGLTLSYDYNGNLTNFGSRTYTWNSRDQLTATSDGGSSFVYDAFGRRVSRTVSAVATQYLHDGADPITVNGALMLQGLGPDEFYARISGGTVTSFLADALGSTLALTDSSGAINASYSYGAYGNASKTGTDDTSFQYTGRENDGNGLYYYRNRYYSPHLSRFISEDPIGLAGGQNVFAYTRGNPIRFIDPYGLQDAPSDPALESLSDSPPEPRSNDELACLAAVDKMRYEREALDARDKGDESAWISATKRAQAEDYKYLKYMGQQPEGNPPDLPPMPPSAPHREPPAFTPVIEPADQAPNVSPFTTLP